MRASAFAGITALQKMSLLDHVGIDARNLTITTCNRRRCTFAAGLVLQIAAAATNFITAAAHAEPIGAAPEQDATLAGDVDTNGSTYTRPQNIFDLRFRNIDSSSTKSGTENDSLLLRLTEKFDLAPGWKMAVFGELPFTVKTTTAIDSTKTDRENGIGDALFQAWLTHPIDQRWAFSFGARLVDPTASDNLGGDKWVVMPGAGIRYSLAEWGPDSYFFPSMRYAMSFAGDPTRRNVNEAQIAPTLNIALPGRSFITLYPSNDIRINYGDPVPGQTGRLFLPVDVAFGRNLTDDVVESLEASLPSVSDYPVYTFKAQLRVAVRF